MEILKSLGIDGTVWIHLACFVVAYVSISQLVFKPYLKALHEREKLTVGNEESAVRIIDEAKELGAVYETRARALNEQLKSVYDEQKSLALKAFDQATQKARAQSGEKIGAARALISKEMATARHTVTAEAPLIASAIASKLAGKELN